MNMDILTLADFREVFKLSLENLADLIGNRDNQTVGKAARGAISCTSWTVSADYSTAKVREILSSIDTSLCEYAYRKFVRQKTSGKTKEYIIKSLLTQALSYNKEYQIKHTEISMSVKSKQEFQYTSDHFFEQWISSNLTPAANQTSDSIISNADPHFGSVKKQDTSLYASLERFVADALAADSEIDVVNLAFNQGLRWLFNEERNALLEEIFERAGQVNILMTEPQVSDQFTKHQRESRTFEITNVISPIQVWTTFIQKHNLDKITLKKSPLPILRHYISFHYKEEKESVLYVGFYTYGRGSLDKNQFFVTSSNEQYYASYRNEFDYLWKLSTSVEGI